MDLQFIVGRLKEEPFGIDIRAVDFDEKSPDEHLQILNNVFATLDRELKADVRTASRDDVVEQMLQFLMMHKCPLIPSSEDARFMWIDGLRQGGKAALYPVLQWALSEYATLKKRAYLSRYLMPLDVPPEHLMQSHGNVEDLLEAYKDLQDQFVEVHKQYEAVIANTDRPASEILSGIKQMEAEERQLRHRLEQERSRTCNNTGFQRLLAEAREMRLAQDKEIGLEDQKGEQLRQLATTRRETSQTRHMLEIVAACEAKPTEEVLANLEREARDATHQLETKVVPQRHRTELMLLHAEKEADSDAAECDSEYATEMAAQLEEKKDELNKLGGDPVGSDSELSTLQKEANDSIAKSDAACKLHDAKVMEKELLLSTNKELRDSIDALIGNHIQLPDGTRMSKEEFSRFQESVNRTKSIYVDSREGMARIKDEICQLERSEEALKAQYRDLQARVQEEEERAGVTGFQEINHQLRATSREIATVNASKAQMLEDISVIVQQMGKTLDSKKPELEPKVRELKQKREQFHQLKERHQTEKARYDDVVAKVRLDNKSIESDCSRLQKEWLEKERDLHLLVAKNEIAASKLDVLPALDSLKDLCESKIAEQKNLSAKLRTERGDCHSEEYKSNQQAMFSNLKKLLELKARAPCTGE